MYSQRRVQFFLRMGCNQMWRTIRILCQYDTVAAEYLCLFLAGTCGFLWSSVPTCLLDNERLEISIPISRGYAADHKSSPGPKVDRPNGARASRLSIRRILEWLGTYSIQQVGFRCLRWSVLEPEECMMIKPKRGQFDWLKHLCHPQIWQWFAKFLQLLGTIITEDCVHWRLQKA